MNASLGEAPVVELTLPHVLRSHKTRFSEILLVVDTRPREGRLAIAANDDWQRFQVLTDGLADAGIPVKLLEVDYSSGTVKKVNAHWFGKDVDLRCSAGTPIYQFLYGLESCSSEVRLHVDCDMLFFDSGPTSWIDQAIGILEQDEEVLFANPAMGPPGSTPGDHEFLAARHPRTGLRTSHRFSTRCFLLDAAKLERCLLPLRAAQHHILRRVWYRSQGRSNFLALELMISGELTRRGFLRCDIDPARGFCLHAWDKAALLDGMGQRIISDVEAGVVPSSQYNLVNLVAPWST